MNQVSLPALSATFTHVAWVFCGAGTFSASSLAGPSLALDFPASSGELFKASYDDVRITMNQGSNSPTETDLHKRAGLLHGGADGGDSDFDVTSLFRDEDEMLASCVDVPHFPSHEDTYRVEDIATNQVDERDDVRRPWQQSGLCTALFTCSGNAPQQLLSAAAMRGCNRPV